MSKTNNIETSGTEYVFEEGEMTNLSSRDTGPRCSGDVEDGFKPTMHTLQYIVVPPEGLEISSKLRFSVLQKEPLTNKESERLRQIQKVNARLCTINAFWPLVSKANIKYVRMFSWKNRYVTYVMKYMAFIGLLAHISTDVFESYMYRGLATAVTFLVLFCFILSTVILGKKSAILFFKEVEKALKINEMDCHQRKFVFAQIDTKVSGGMPKSIPAHFVQAVFSSIIWFGLLYWEGIIQMEYNTFGPVFVCAHVFLTTWCFVNNNTDNVYILYLFKRLGVYTKAFDDDVAYIKNCLLNDLHGGGKAQLSPMFGNQVIQMSIMKAYIKLKIEIKDTERVCGLMQAISLVVTVLIYVTVSISVATQDYSKKPFVPIYGFMYVSTLMNFQIFSCIPPFERKLKRLSCNVRDVAHLGGFTKLINFLRDEKELSYKLLGIALDWQLVGKIIILVLSVAATLLQYYLL